MGIRDFVRRMFHGKPTDRQLRIGEAAEQFWDAVNRGMTFEVPATLSSDDDTMQALTLLAQMHPEVDLRVLQSRAIVVTKVKDKGIKVSEEAWNTLAGAGYVPEKQKSVTDFLASHEAFMRHQGLDPAEQLKYAAEDAAKRNAMELRTSTTDGKNIEETIIEEVEKQSSEAVTPKEGTVVPVVVEEPKPTTEPTP